MDELSQIFQGCISPDYNTRIQAEGALQGYQNRQDFIMVALQYITQAQNPNFVKLACITLKNHVIKMWVTGDSGGIDYNVKEQFKGMIYNTMTSMNESLGSILREAIVHIASHEFPNYWPQLLQSICVTLQQSYTAQPLVTKACLLLCHNMFKRYRYSFRSDELWSEIKLVIDNIFPHYMRVTQEIYNSLQQAQSPQEFDLHLNVFDVLLQVFISLNGQDIPQQFEDSLKEWMSLFTFLLGLEVQALPNDEMLFNVKARVLKGLSLYAQKYDEDFEPYAEGFCRSVWEMLSKTAGQTKYDRFISSALDFFCVVILKPQIAQLMSSNLQVMFSNLILPNMLLSEYDEDLAESTPLEFVKMYLEDANDETRRGACFQLMKSLVKQFPEQLAKIMADYQSDAIQQYQNNPTGGWKYMDALILLLSGVFASLYTPRHGATALNTTPEYILGVFDNLVMPNIQNTNLPILVSSCLKFIYVYRNQFPIDRLPVLIDTCSQLIEQNDQLIVSYASATLERLMMIRQSEGVLLVTKDMVAPILSKLLQNLAGALYKFPKNIYIMRSFFRVVWLAQDRFADFVIPACDVLIEYLKQVMLSPADADPHYTSLVFECLALTIQNSGNNIGAVQEKLESYMGLIIQKSNPDLLPYAFQIQALFIKLTGQLSQMNNNLFDSILPLNNWESGSKYYAPSLVTLLETVIKVTPDRVQGKEKEICDIAQQVIRFGLDSHAFGLIGTLIEMSQQRQYVLSQVGQIFILIFTKLHNSRMQNIRLTQRFHKSLIVFLSRFINACGAEVVQNVLNNVQSGIFEMLIKGEVTQHIRAIDTVFERKIVAVAMSNLLTSQFLSQEVWAITVVSLAKMLEMTSNLLAGTLYSNGMIDLPEENTMQMSQSSHQKLAMINLDLEDQLPQVQDVKQLFVRSISRPDFWQIMQPVLDNQTGTILQNYFQMYQVQMQ